jgi:tetratricopeptide (TPR) repeat protein
MVSAMSFKVKMLLSFLFLVAASCSSKDKAQEVGDSGGGSETYTPPATAKSGTALTTGASDKSDLTATPVKATTKAASDALNQALRSNDLEALQKTATGLLAQNSNDPKALSALGVVNAQKGQRLAALYFFKKSLALNPTSPETLTNIGLVYQQQKDNKEAMKNFKKAVDLGASDGIAATNLGVMYAKEGDYFKAMPLLDRAVKAGVKDGRIYNNYGIALAFNGKYEEAKEIYQQAIKQGQGSREAHFNLAILLIDHMNQPQPGLDTISRLKAMGLSEGMRDRINNLEIKAKAGLK